MCDEENWDDADYPPYIPNIENRKIIKVTPPRMTKSQKKLFYAQERERWQRLRAIEQQQQQQQQKSST